MVVNGRIYGEYFIIYFARVFLSASAAAKHVAAAA